MNWVYTIVFSGLLFSQGGELERPSQNDLTSPDRVLVVQDGERERIEQSYPLSSNGRVKVSNINGSIILESWDRNEVRLEATKIAQSKEALAAMQLKIDSRADHFSVEVDLGDWRKIVGERGWKNMGRNEVQFKLSVPRTAVLDDIETVNGSVTVSGFTNITKVSAVNGNVSAANLRGSASLETVNGEVKAEFDQLDPAGRISLETVNGRAHLVIPSDSNATVKADTLNGSITNDFGLTVRKGKYVGRDLHGRLGSGETQVKLDTVNGHLLIQKKNDGKQTNPVTNLLQGGSDSDDEWNRDVSSTKAKSEKINKDIAKAVSDSTQAISEAGAKLAQAEVARILPEIEKIRSEALEKMEPVDVAELTRTVSEAVTKQTEVFGRLANANWTGGATFIERKTNSFPVKGTPRVTVDAKGCSVRVRGWDRPEVKYVLTEISRSTGRVRPTVEENATESSVELKVRNNERASRDIFFNGDSESVRLEIFVPKNSNMKIVSNGEIRIDGVSGDVELVGVDESIDIRDGNGKLKVSAIDGQVRVIGYSGEIESTTSGGDVFLEGTFNKIEGRSTEGSFVLTVPEGQNADVRSNVGSILLDGFHGAEAVKEGHWRLGRGGASFNFTVEEGEVRIRNVSSLSGSR